MTLAEVQEKQSRQVGFSPFSGVLAIRTRGGHRHCRNTVKAEKAKRKLRQTAGSRNDLGTKLDKERATRLAAEGERARALQGQDCAWQREDIPWSNLRRGAEPHRQSACFR